MHIVRRRSPGMQHSEHNFHKQLSVPLSEVAYTQQLPGECKHRQLCRTFARAHMKALVSRRQQWTLWLKTCQRRRFVVLSRHLHNTTRAKWRQVMFFFCSFLFLFFMLEYLGAVGIHWEFFLSMKLQNSLVD